ncbi:hypothetical protein [Geomesophilobacter sediminis]|uniref:Uncharacterized protein n=1 Tax=Geomesophilobacter sediminis TaxID=2798584 RepID=A0A8J7IMJ5_9BACT|nr:hypothetical protein [Geomesophilobacter sediminis]MBJ6723978.1 hypothetical protein [Geomesophilobacter sediminis]
MDQQYNIINQCLHLLKHSDMPTIKKLRVEIQLIQMKRLLLNESIPMDVRRGSCSTEVFEGLLTQMRGVCHGPSSNEGLAELMNRIGGMLSMLGGRHLSS